MTGLVWSLCLASVFLHQGFVEVVKSEGSHHHRMLGYPANHYDYHGAGPTTSHNSFGYDGHALMMGSNHPHITKVAMLDMKSTGMPHGASQHYGAPAGGFKKRKHLAAQQLSTIAKATELMRVQLSEQNRKQNQLRFELQKLQARRPYPPQTAAHKLASSQTHVHLHNTNNPALGTAYHPSPFIAGGGNNIISLVRVSNPPVPPTVVHAPSAPHYTASHHYSTHSLPSQHHTYHSSTVDAVPSTQLHHDSFTTPFRPVHDLDAYYSNINNYYDV